MKHVISLYTVEKLVDNKLAVYPKKTQTCSKCTFDALSDNYIHLEKKYQDIEQLKDIV